MKKGVLSKKLSCALFLVAFGVMATTDAFACLVCRHDQDRAGGSGWYCDVTASGWNNCDGSGPICYAWGSCKRDDAAPIDSGPLSAARQAIAVAESASETCNTNRREEPHDSAATQAFASIDTATILRIAEQHPRFAATLAELRRSTGEHALGDYFTLYLLPVPMTSTEVKSWITPSAAFLEQLREESQRTYSPEMVPTEYKITFDYAPDSRVATIRLQVIGGSELSLDPSYSSLEITMGNDGPEQWSVQEWKIH
jgi:hypothetical protein